MVCFPHLYVRRFHKQKQKAQRDSPPNLSGRCLLPIRFLFALVTSARVISVRHFWFRGNNTALSTTWNPRAICQHNTTIAATGWQRDRSSRKITRDAWSVCRNTLFHLLTQIGGSGSIQILEEKKWHDTLYSKHSSASERTAFKTRKVSTHNAVKCSLVIFTININVYVAFHCCNVSGWAHLNYFICCYSAAKAGVGF